MNVSILARVDADLEAVRLEAIGRASTLGGHIIGDPDVTTTGTVNTDQGVVTLDGSGFALYTSPVALAFTGTQNIAPVLLPPRVL